MATGRIETAAWPYLPGSVLPVRVDGFSAPYHIALSGPGTLLDGGLYAVPDRSQSGTAMLVAGNAVGLAASTVRVAKVPDPNTTLVAVASYDDGIVFHDGRNYSVLGVLSTGGAPGDAAIDAKGRVVAPDTQGTTVTVATLAPWNVAQVSGVPLGDEIAVDDATHAVFVTNRDTGGSGALTRIDQTGGVTRVATGQTAEGLAIDGRRQIVYVANVNDDTIAAVDARSMRLIRKFHAVARIFSLALSPDGRRLYGISNQSAGSPFAAPGSAVAISLSGASPRIVARSHNLTFPLGVALDASTNTLFVTDESLDVVYVLDARTLREKRPPLTTCRTPWKPDLDATRHLLYVPCARADRVDVFETRSLRRVKSAPFATGGYPLAVAVWHG